MELESEVWGREDMKTNGDIGTKLVEVDLEVREDRDRECRV